MLLPSSKNQKYAKSRRNNHDSTIYEFHNGIYQGELFDFKRNGYGLFFWDNSQVYLGQWKDDFMEGIGMIFFGFGGYLYGKFTKNKLNGPGVMIFPNGDIYASYWKNGKLHEKCLKYCNEDKSWCYIRYYYGIKLEGEKSMNCEDIYQEFLKIKNEIIENSPFEYKEFHYTFPYASFLKEKGYKFSADKRVIDFLSTEDDSWYYGITFQGQPDGIGVLGTKNQVKFKGVFQNGKLEGIGRMDQENGDIYDGLFIDGQLIEGIIYLKEKESFVYGQFKSGKMVKLMAEGKGFPINILSKCKHNIYSINYSYFYKYTALEVIYLNELEKQINQRVPLRKSYSPFKKNNKNNKSPTKIQSKENYSSSKHENPITTPNISPQRKESLLSCQKMKFSDELPRKENLKKGQINDKIENTKNSRLESPEKSKIESKCNTESPKKEIFESKNKVNELISSLKEKINVKTVVKKPTSIDYNSNSKILYKDDFDLVNNCEEDSIGKVNVWNLKKYASPNAPSFGDLNNLKIESSAIYNYKVEHSNINNNDFKEEKERIKKHLQQENNSHPTYKEKNKQALIVYYDSKNLFSDGKTVDFNIDCYNLFNKKVERPVHIINDSIKLTKINKNT